MNPRNVAFALATLAIAAAAFIGANIKTIAQEATHRMRATNPSGSAITLFTEKRMCVGAARYAEFLEGAGPAVAGCWVPGPGFIALVFFDGDTAQVPMAAFAPVGRDAV